MYIDLLTRIKNAQKARKESMKLPYSTMDMAVAELLVKHGYLLEAAKKGRMPRRVIEIRLAYPNGNPAITGINVISKPSRRLYAGYRDLRKVKQGLGMSVLSTPQGIMGGMDARKKKVGGQLLFEIW